MIPVWVREDPRNFLSVVRLVETEAGIAVDPAERYMPAGTLLKAKWTQPGANGQTVKKEGWRWFQIDTGGIHTNGVGGPSDRKNATGRAQTKAKARANLLKSLGYREVLPEATNPGLFET